MKFEKYIADEVERAKKFTRPCYPFIWDIEGVCVITNPKVCQKLKVTLLDVITGGTIFINGDPLIIVSQRPDFNNPLHKALLYHELGHVVNGDIKITVNNFLEVELAADKFSADRVGVEHIQTLLVTIYKEYKQRNILYPFVQSVLVQRLKALGYQTDSLL